MNNSLQVPQPAAAVMKAPMFGSGVLAPAFVSMEARPKYEGTPQEIYNIDSAKELATLTRRLHACGALPLLIAADQLVQNGDRNIGNLGFTGKQTIVAFDHSDILGGCDWHESTLHMPSGWAGSKLIEDLVPLDKISPAMSGSIMAAVLSCLQRFYAAQLDTRAVLKTTSNSTSEAAMNAIWWRSLELERWFSQKLGMLGPI